MSVKVDRRLYVLAELVQQPSETNIIINKQESKGSSCAIYLTPSVCRQNGMCASACFVLMSGLTI